MSTLADVTARAGATLTRRLVEDHLVEGRAEPGEEVALRVDQARSTGRSASPWRSTSRRGRWRCCSPAGC